MAVRTADPWGEKSSFENMTKSAGSAVVKAVSDTVKTVVSDMKEQTGIPSYAKATEGQGAQEKQSEQVKQAEQERQKNLNEIKANLQKINQEIQQVRRERQQKEQEKKKVEKQEKQVKKQEEQKKDSEPFWKKMMKGRSGSREGAKKQGS